MRFSRRPLRASVVHVIAAFAPMAGCMDTLDVTSNPPACNTPGCVPALNTEDVGIPVERDAATVGDTECPAEKPSSDAPCALPEGFRCSYGPYCDDTAVGLVDCLGGRWSPQYLGCNPPQMRPLCPPTEPVAGGRCDQIWGPPECNYGSCDGSAEVSYKCAATWHVVARCGKPVCPTERPVSGTPCAYEGPDCGYDDCGGAPSSTASCRSGVWSVRQRSCNPPPADQCPGLAPAEGSPCPSARLRCTFSLSAGGTVVGMCVGGTWKLGVADAGT